MLTIVINRYIVANNADLPRRWTCWSALAL